MRKRGWIIFGAIVGLMVLIGVVGLTTSYLNDTEASTGNTASSNWLNYDWLYRKPITLTNGGGALTNYQLRLEVDTLALVNASRLQSDGDDLRFTTGDGQTLLDYWIESGINTATTVIWVEVASIPAGSSTIYMYYANAAAAGVSNGDNVFIYFNNFELAADINDWVEVNGTRGAQSRVTTPAPPFGSYSMLVDDTSGLGTYGVYTTFTAQTACIVEYYARAAQTDEAWEMRVNRGTTLGGRLRFNTDTDIEWWNNSTSAFNDFSPTIFDYLQDVWYSFSWDEVETADATDTFDIYINTVLQRSNIVFDNNVASVNRIYFQTTTNSANGELYVDLVKVRQWTSSIPSYSLGIEE